MIQQPTTGLNHHKPAHVCKCINLDFSTSFIIEDSRLCSMGRREIKQKQGRGQKIVASQWLASPSLLQPSLAPPSVISFRQPLTCDRINSLSTSISCPLPPYAGVFPPQSILTPLSFPIPNYILSLPFPHFFSPPPSQIGACKFSRAVRKL